MPDVQEVFRMSTQKVGPDPGALERQHTRQRRRSVGKKLGAFAVAAAIAVVAVVLIANESPGGEQRTPAGSPTQTTQTDAEAIQVATSFLTAYGESDADLAISYLGAYPSFSFLKDAED